ncbi:hypothetical protein K2Q16_00115 [Patescibacteria group bacterium]|nr:hypothetical protein [Patescibacteria group bacterium]
MSTSFVSTLSTIATTQVLIFMAVATIALGVFGGGPIALGLFYILLVTFSTLVSYRLVLVRTFKEAAVLEAGLPHIDADAPAPHPGIFVEKVAVDTRPLVQFSDGNVPANLPVLGYSNPAESVESTEEAHEDAELARALENQAHTAHVLLSTDALRHFVATVPSGTDLKDLMASVIKAVKSRYPSEDGWVVVSESRMRDVCVACLATPVSASSTEPYVPTVIPEGTGSLAEMITLGNLGAAFALIGHRPMFALADAVADFDALYRSRRGDEVNLSALLRDNTETMSDDSLKAVINALTSALDGTYTDEAEAVKTAIMKAIKARG